MPWILANGILWPCFMWNHWRLLKPCFVWICHEGSAGCTRATFMLCSWEFVGVACCFVLLLFQALHNSNNMQAERRTNLHSNSEMQPHLCHLLRPDCWKFGMIRRLHYWTQAHYFLFLSWADLILSKLNLTLSGPEKIQKLWLLRAVFVRNLSSLMPSLDDYCILEHSVTAW